MENTMQKLTRPMRGLLAIATAAALLSGTGLAVGTPAFASDPSVIPINFAILPLPVDALSTQVKQVLQNTNKYAVTTWWNTTKNYDAQSASTYLDFGGIDELSIRTPAAQTLGLATAIRLGIYDPTFTTVPTTTATAETIKLITSLAYRHSSNTAGGWGMGFQTAQWAAITGQSAWLFWDYLSTAQRTTVQTMILAEANRFLTYVPHYYRSTTGIVLTPGDTKAEEIAWDDNILQLATAMMPNHANYPSWMQMRLRMSLASYARPADLASPAIVVNGQRFDYWLNGSNVYNDGTVVNHGLVHPAYMNFAMLTTIGAIDQGLAGKTTPYADVRGFPVIYKALVDLPWTPGPTPAQYTSDSHIRPTIFEPGGVIYHTTETCATCTTDIYYPMGNDWGPGSRIDFALMDVMGTSITSLYGKLDSAASTGGSYWAPIHLTKILNMQARYGDRHSYASGENLYGGAEEYVAQMAANAYLVRLLSSNGKITVSNATY
jgi:hypothetical protein